MTGCRRTVRALLASAVFTCSTFATAVPAGARFSTTSQANQTLGSATLQAPSGLTVKTGCSVLVLGPNATLQWTSTPSLFASGYKVERWRASTLEATTTVTPRTTTTLTETGLRSGTSYTWRVYAFYQSWTSGMTSTSGTTPSLCL